MAAVVTPTHLVQAGVGSTVFTVVVVQAFFHAGWNFLARKVKGNFVVLQLGIWLWSAVTFPLAVYVNVAFSANELFPGLYYALGSGILHALYFWVLAQSYSIGDVSVVYPVGRGSAVAFTALLDVFFLSSYLAQPPITPLGWLGIIGVTLGVLLVGIRFTQHVLVWRHGSVAIETKEANGGPPQSRVLLWALALGSLIALYTAVDVLGLRYWDTFTFLYINYLSSVVCTLPWLLGRYREEAATSWRDLKLYVVLIGFASPGTHLVVLWALSGGQTAYIVAIREVAIVVAAFLGFIFLKEDVTPQKLVGIGVLIAAIICIKLA